MSDRWLEFRVSTPCTHTSDIYDFCPMCRIAELEDFRTHVKDAVSQCQDKGFDVVPMTVLEYLLEKVAK